MKEPGDKPIANNERAGIAARFAPGGAGPEYLALGVAALISAALLWWGSGSALVAVAYLGGLAVIAGAAFTALSRRAPAEDDRFAQPDWSVTVAAIEREGQAVAITDRANRLVCANGAYRDWFGPLTAPAALDAGGTPLLESAARAAWRDGAASKDARIGDRLHEVRVQRAGRAEDHLVWQFTPEAQGTVGAGLPEMLLGPLGAQLSAAGIEAALVDEAGVVRCAAPGFAARAVGDASTALAGQEFVTFLRSDSRDRIFFAREGTHGAPQILLQVPVGDGDAQTNNAAGEPSLMLLVDAGAGLGGGAEGDARAGTEQLQLLMERLPLGLAMADRDGRFLFANPAFRRASGIDARRLPPYPSDIVVKEDKGAIVEAVRRFARGPASAGDMAVRLRSAPDDPVSLGLAGIRGLGEAAVLFSLADSTEETQLKRQVAQATKMQAVGQLAGGVAHDFNNVLTAILGTCDLMLLRHAPGDSDYDDIQQIRANSNRAASLTRQLLAFSRQQTLQPVVLQLPDVISEIGQLLNRLLSEKIRLSVHHDRDLGAVRADPQQLEQVIMNLAVNARDAMLARGDKGRLRIATRRIAPADIRRMGSEIIPVGEYTAMIVEDTGGGIAPDNLGKIFEPFFTTKELGKGTGLGLSTVYGIVKQSGGYIFADNVTDADGRPTGARFTLYLPVHRAQPGDAPAPAPKPASPPREFAGGGNVLLVEDEDMVRAVAERALVREGYSVITASDGEEGLALIEKGGDFDIVVSDVVMPSMDGPAMVRAIRKLRPDLPVLFMSGYAESQLRAEIDVDAMHFIAKPFSVQQISDKVGAVLAAP